MTGPNPVFESTYTDYLSRIGEIDLHSIADCLGVRVRGGGVDIKMFDKVFHVSSRGIVDRQGARPGFDVCVILCRYLLMCPARLSLGTDWVTYNGLRDSGPLTKFFQNEVELPIATHFSGRIDELGVACRALGGYSADIDGFYDLVFGFSALPMVPVVLLFNDRDDDFPASASLLFQRRAEQYLDPECLAMLGWYLSGRLID